MFTLNSLQDYKKSFGEQILFGESNGRLCAKQRDFSDWHQRSEYDLVLSPQLLSPVRNQKNIAEFHNCEQCDYTTNLKRNLTRHVKSNHMKSKPFACDQCAYSTIFKSRLQKHINAVHLKLKLGVFMPKCKIFR